MFTVGELVCYPMHGVGKVEEIVRQTVLGVTSDYYSLRFSGGKMTALVPVNTAERVGLRPLIDRKECDAVLEYLKKPGDRGNDNWNQRYRDNMEKMRSGSIYEVSDVVKCLKLRESERGLSAGERKMLATAKLIVLGELATVLNVDQSSVEEKIS
ncbi:MAG: CarD family transcriptional regulator [Clostridia bacterium]|nr:CarD family transcriptional regulator [Clostridia bacterium]